VSREVIARLDDMIEAAERIIAWTPAAGGVALIEVVARRYHLERAIEILGEAARHVPANVRKISPEFPWRAATGRRDVLAHAYVDIDPDVLASVGLEARPKTLPYLRELRLYLIGEEGN